MLTCLIFYFTLVAVMSFLDSMILFTEDNDGFGSLDLLKTEVKSSVINNFRSVYNKGRKNYANIKPNSFDCNLLISKNEFGKYSCDKILNNSCYHNYNNCFEKVEPSINSQVIKNTIFLSPLSSFVFYMFSIMVMSSCYNCKFCFCRSAFRTNFTKYGTIEYPTPLQNKLCLGVGNPVLIWLGIPFILLLFLTIFHCIPFSSIATYEFFAKPVLERLDTFNNLVDSELKNPMFSTHKPDSIKEFIFEGCQNNNWIQTDLDLKNCRYYYGKKICCIDDLEYNYTPSGLELIEFIKQSSNIKKFNSIRISSYTTFFLKYFVYIFSPLELIILFRNPILTLLSSLYIRIRNYQAIEQTEQDHV